MNLSQLRRFINLWPPFLFTGIRATRIVPDFSEIDVTLKLRWFNRSFVGTHFGGSLFAMTDAWYMLMLMHRLGRGYQVWDRSASIEFLTPARGDVHASFRLTEEAVERIRTHTAHGDKYLPQFEIDVLDSTGRPIARVVKTLYVRARGGQVDAHSAAREEGPAGARQA